MLIKIRNVFGPGPTGLRSDRWKVFLFKIWAPLLLGSGLVGLVLGSRFPGNLLFVVPLALALLFYLTLAQVEIHGRKVLYRRVFGWVRVDLREIQASGQAWVFGYIQLDRFVLPWRRVYFVRDRDPEAAPWQWGNSAILGFLRENCRAKG
jgi:hypothetical protein